MEKTGVIQEFERVKEKYSGLHLRPLNYGTWEILGNLHFLGKFHSETIADVYLIRIYVPSAYPKELPRVWELGGRIPKGFHKFIDESLCLGTSLEIKIKFHKCPNLLGFIEQCIVEYLFGYSYKLKHGQLPAGERAHGIDGVIEHYKELFSTTDLVDVVKLLESLICQTYSPEQQCPCGSKKTMDQCHLEALLKLLDYQSVEKYMLDFIDIDRVFRLRRSILEKDLYKYVMSFNRRQRWIRK